MRDRTCPPSPTSHAAAATLLALLALAAPAAGAPPEFPARDRGDLAVRARAVLRRHCAECHGDRPRRGDVSVLDHARLAAPAYPVPLINPAEPRRSLLLEFIRDGSMPPGGRPGPTADEVKTLTDWVAAGAPGYPRAFDDASALAAAAADWDARPPAARSHLRYLTLAHLVHDDAPPPDLRAAEGRLRAALRAGAGREVPATPVDPAATVFRIDLGPAGWAAGDLFDRVERGGPRANAHPLTAFDVLMLEYPHRPPEGGAAARMAAGMGGVRKMPVVRGDWLADALAPGAPLAADVRALADLAAGKAGCGPQAGRHFTTPGTADRPLEAWYAGDPAVGPFAFTTDLVPADQPDTPTAEVRVGESFRLRVQTDRPVRVRVVSVLSDNTTRLQVLEKDSLPAGTTLLGPRTNVPFAAGGLRGDVPETEYFAVFAAEADVPVPTVLRSRHADGIECRERNHFPVWRFLFEPTDPRVDPARVARRIVPLTVRNP